MPAWLVIGIEIAEAPELNSPSTAIAFLFCATLRALAEVAPASHWPAWAVESSSALYDTVQLPALFRCCFSASRIPASTSRVCGRFDPCRGRLEKIVTFLLAV